MKKILIFVAAVLGAVGIAGLGGLTAAAPAQATCADGFTSIPCTIAEQVAQAPATVAGVGCAQPKPVGGKQYNSTCGLPSITNLVNVGCPPDDKGNQTDPCGLPAVPGQLAAGLASLPGQALVGAQQVATAPVAIAGGLLTAPQQIANALGKAPKQFADAVTHGGTDPDPDN